MRSPSQMNTYASSPLKTPRSLKPYRTANSIVIGEPEQEMDVEMSAPAPEPFLQEPALPKPTVDEIIEKRTGDAVDTNVAGGHS